MNVDDPDLLDRNDPDGEISRRGKAYRNWGRWGEDDVLGTLNFIDAAKRQQAAALVRDGDWIELDAFAGRLHLDVPQAELDRRLEDWPQSQAGEADRPRLGGYKGLYLEHVTQADEGCDFDFLVGCRGADVPSHSH